MSDKKNNNTEEELKSRKEKEPIDLSILAELRFGPQWSQSKLQFSGEPRDDRRRRGREKQNQGREQENSIRRDRRPIGFNKERRQGRPGQQQFRDRDQFREPREEFRPNVDVSFYPEDQPFQVLTKAIRTTCKTYELFDIARLILEKPERFVVLISSIQQKDGKPKDLYYCPFDGIPFFSEEECIAYALKEHMQQFFNVEEVTVEPPKGSFPIINKCGITGELLGPPNYHRYQALIKAHHAANLPNMPFEKFVSRIEPVRNEEEVKKWLEKMTKSQRYTLKNTPEGSEPKVFEAWEEARAYILQTKRNDLVRAKESVRFSGKLINAMPRGDIRRFVELMLRKQNEFPLQTANNLRGRLRRMKFNLYKIGSKGISYVSAMKRKFRDETTKFADSIQKVIEFIEKNPKISIGNLTNKYLGIAKAVVPEPKTGEVAVVSEQPQITSEQQGQVRQLMLDLRWLVSEGYVTEFGNGTLIATPRTTALLKKKVESADGGERSPEELESKPKKETEKPPKKTARNKVKKNDVKEEAPAEGERPETMDNGDILRSGGE